MWEEFILIRMIFRKIGISLGTDKNGKVIYKLYDINNNIVKQDEMN